MSRHISPSLRKKVAIRANFKCEYCRLPEMAAMLKFQIEHIISLQHGGRTIFSNLAYACPICNANKGPNVGTLLDDEKTFIRFYHPRQHKWEEHFEIQNGWIVSKTKIGEGTIKILDFNTPEKILERIDLIEAGLYP